MRVLTLEELTARPLEEALRDIAVGETVRVKLDDDGHVAEITGLPQMKPLPVFDMKLPANWRDALYACPDEVPSSP